MVIPGAYVAATAAAAAGITGDALVIAVAIAGAESSWNLTAVGDENLPEKGCGSYGLWQINSCPERDANSPTRYGSDPRVLFDPLVNARAMAAISSGGTNWAPWTVWKTGAYRSKIGDAKKAVDAIDPKQVAKYAAVERVTDAPPNDKGKRFGFSIGTPFGDITSESGPTGVLSDAANKAAGLVLDPLASVAAFFGELLKASTWMRALGLIVGLLVLGLGLSFIAKDIAGVDVAGLASTTVGAMKA